MERDWLNTCSMAMVQAALAGALLSMGASLGMGPWVSAALADAGTDAAGMSAALQNVPAVRTACMRCV